MADKFARIQNGTLVRRSRHWHKQHPSYRKGQLGIVVDRYVTQEGDWLITYPIVHWEGEHGSTMVHPMNMEIAASKYRK